MKKILGIATTLLAFLVIIAGCSSNQGPSASENSSQPASTETPVSYEISSSHFVKNTYKGETNPSYLLIRSYSSFESLFGIAMTMNTDKSKLITAEKMKNKFIFSIIYQGNDVYKFGIEKITLKNKQLQVHYTSEVTEKNASWTGNFHITLLVQNCDFSSILLFENGEPLNDAKMKEYD